MLKGAHINFMGNFVLYYLSLVKSVQEEIQLSDDCMNNGRG